MITHFLGDEEVAAYCRDLAERITSPQFTFPTMWVELGTSGRKIRDALFEQVSAISPESARTVSSLVVRYDRTRDAIEYSGGTEGLDLSSEGTILILDSAVHSGRSMLCLYRSLCGFGATDILSYSLVLKAGSVMIPTYFGLVIDDKDRAYFQLKALPNNRLGNPPTTGVLREVTEEDVDRQIEEVGPPFIDLTVGDMVYDAMTKHSKVYIFEKDNKIAGFISFRRISTTLFIDAWGTALAYRNHKIGGATMRWAETWARSQRCEQIELWAFGPAIDKYLTHGYDYADDRERNLGGGQKYRIMNKKILYNIKPTSSDELKTFY